MKQIIQSFRTGETMLEDVPKPNLRSTAVLIKTTRSLVSLGTERMLVEFGKANLLQKARQQPERVREVLDKIKTDGLLPTIEVISNKLEQPLPLGYCNVGRIVAVGEQVKDFKIGERVASNGPHAEFVCIPENLVAHIPENVSDEEATFTVVGSIGLQGVRLCRPSLGETIVVIGLGLIGQITADLLVASGCRVVGIDPDASKVAIVKGKGIEAFSPLAGFDPVQHINNLTSNVGADAVIITASSKSNEIISQSAKMCRKRGRIILIGVIGLDIKRSDFYEKELSFQVSCSYGPGRYDDNYEERGIDYPLPYVRWTENRNFRAILQVIAAGKLDVKSLITERVPLVDYRKIYSDIGQSHSIASILEYPEDVDDRRVICIQPSDLQSNNSSSLRGVIGIIGAGNFTKMTLLPVFEKRSARLKYIVSENGLSGTALAKKYKIENSTTDYQEVLNDEEVDLVLITTRHNQHASMVIDSLKAGKNVFVEKPLALNLMQLEQIMSAYRSPLALTVGFNRRFSPHAIKIKSLLGTAPVNIIATMNAGFIPPNVWIHDMEIGGGRIIGEACHFIDLITFLTGSKVESVCMNSMGQYPRDNTDNASILLKYENGSTGVINYFANGSKAYSKERIEVYSQGRTAIIDNFRITEGYGFKQFTKLKTKLDKGHKDQFRLLLERMREGGEVLIPYDEIINTTQASFAAVLSLREGRWINLPLL